MYKTGIALVIKIKLELTYDTTQALYVFTTFTTVLAGS